MSAQPAAPALRPSVEVLRDGDDVLLLRSGVGAPDVVIRAPAPALRALVERLEGHRGTTAELEAWLAEHGHALTEEEVAKTLAQLAGVGVLTEGPEAEAELLTADQRERYDRQLHFFADVSDEPRHRIQRRLLDASVCVIGVGGLGTWAATGLALAGVGRLVLVDADTVSASNLHRQVLFGHGDLGRPKVEVAAAALLARAPDLTVTTHARLIAGPADLDVAAGCELVIATADTPADRIGLWIDEGCRRLGIPHLEAAQFPPRIRVGPLVVPGRTPGICCLHTQLRRDEPRFDAIMRMRAGRSDPAATIASASAVVGGLLTAQALEWIGGWAEPRTLGRSALFDLHTFETTWEELPAGGCSSCTPS